MFKKLPQFIRRLSDNTRGNALMIVAAGAPLLIGSAGFAVDTAQWYLWKRELQHAVDQAAYSGAWALSNPDAEGSYSKRALQEYSANVDKVAGFDKTPTIRIADFGDGSQNSIVVSSSATKALPFTNFFAGIQANIKVSAQATFAAGGEYNACIISLAEDETGTTIGGSSTVRARCGIAAMSCDEDAIIIDGNANVETDSIATCGTVNSSDVDLQDVISENVRGLEDIYADIDPPTNDTPQTYNCSGKGKNKQASLRPGTYNGLVAGCDTVFASGIYVIDGGTLDLTHNSSLTGNGVMFVLRNGATMKLGGSGNSNAINLTPPTAADFAGTDYAGVADNLAGILVFEERDNQANNSHIFNGNSDSLIEGLIYLPDGDLQINGTADVAAQCLKISAFRIKIKGGANLETLCPIDDSTSAGISQAIVRLVA